MTTIEIDTENRWRLETPGHEGWTHSARPDDPNKYFMVTADCHVNEPPDLWELRIEPEYRHRLPRVEVDANGVKWSINEGWGPQKLRELKLTGEDQERAAAGPRDPEQRLRDHARDGIDAEIIFPNKGLAMWATPDPVFSQAMCRVYNTWAWEVFGPYYDRLSPLAAVATGDIDGAIEEVKRVAKLGYRGLTLPSKPVFGAGDSEKFNYNLPVFDPFWAAVQDADLTMTFHVSTGKDPRGAKGNGGAVINYVVHSLAPTMEPIVNLCSSGVLERFPGLRFASIEAGVGWIPWMMVAMDEAYQKHHMWAFPKLKYLPSEYYRMHGAGSFGEDAPGIDLARKWRIVDNLMWANDYPHHEGTWPHSAEAIERTMADLTDDERAKVLGLNAARVFKFEIPERYRNYTYSTASR